MNTTAQINRAIRRLEESAAADQRTADAFRQVAAAMVAGWGTLTGDAAEIMGEEIQKVLAQVKEYDCSAAASRAVAASWKEIR